MKIAIVLCHKSKSFPVEETREIFIASEMRKLGYDVRVFLMSDIGRMRALSFDNYQCPIFIYVPDLHSDDIHLNISTDLIDDVLTFDPEYVFVKGIDYAIAQIISETLSQSKLVAIIGGVSKHFLLEKAAGILYESRIQMHSYNEMQVTALLPKFIRWDLAKIAPAEKRYDLINIGSFEDGRKSQELLTLIPNEFNIVFVGCGARLNAIRQLYLGRNAVFTGCQPPEKVYELIKLSKIMIHVSRFEGFPRVVAESIACGVPVVALKDSVHDIDDNCVMQCELSNISSCVQQLLTNEDELRNFTELTRCRTRDSNSNYSIVEIVVDLVNKLSP